MSNYANTLLSRFHHTAAALVHAFRALIVVAGNVVGGSEEDTQRRQGRVANRA